MNYIGDSIIGEGCSFGAGTVLSNLRFDERNVSVKIEGESIDCGLDKFGAIIGDNSKTGVNVSVMPGMKIGPNSIVGSSVCLTEDLEPDRMAVVDQVKKVTDNKYKVGEEATQKVEGRIRGLRCVE